MYTDDEEIRKLREQWDTMSHDDKVDKFLWKMVWYHHTKHIPGSPSQPIWDLSKVIDNAAKSSDKNSQAMKYLTYALVFLGIAQVVVAYFSYNSEQKNIQIRKQCFQNVLQTSDINLNYISCLRDKGLSN